MASLKAPRKPSPSTVRPNSPRVSGPQKAGVKGTYATDSKHRKSPSIFGPDRNISTAPSSSKPKPLKNLGMLDDKDLLSQSAYFDEADSEIQSIYERVVLDRHMQSSLQEIINAQKMHLHARQSLSGAGATGTGAAGAPRGPSSQPVTPPVTSGAQTGSKEVALGVPALGKDAIAIAVAGTTAGTAAGGARGAGTAGSSASTRVDEDQRSDNTASAGYMHVHTAAAPAAAPVQVGALFQALGLPEPESISDEAIAALFVFAQREMGKRNMQNVPQSPLGVATAVLPATAAAATASAAATISAPSTPQSTRPPSGRRSGPPSPQVPSSSSSPLGGPGRPTRSTHTAAAAAASAGAAGAAGGSGAHTATRRPRSKSGGSEAAVLGLGLDSAAAMPLIPASDDDEVSESGRLPPTEKMLGLAPGYLAKPSPAASPWQGIEGGGGGTRASSAHSQSPTRPVSSSSPLPIQERRYGTPSSSSSAGAGTGSSGRGETLTAREQGVAAGPLRLPAKKLTMPTLSLFSDYFAHERQGPDKDIKAGGDAEEAVDGADAASAGPGEDEAEDGTGAMSQTLQQLGISPRTAFDDISVSSSVASSCSAASSSNSRSRGSAPARRAGAAAASKSSGTGDAPVSTRQKR